MSISITKYPRIERLNVVETVDNGGFVQVKIYRNHENYNLKIDQYIFIVSGIVVGKYKITELVNSGDFGLITIEKAYASDTAGGYLLTNSAVNADSGWNSANFRIEFELQRKDIDVITCRTATVADAQWSGYKHVIVIDVAGNYEDYSISTSGAIYLNAKNESTSEILFSGVKTVLGATYYSSLNTSTIHIEVDSSVNFSDGVGFINSNQYRVNYFSTVRIETKGANYELKVAPDAFGKMTIDVSKYLRTKIDIANIFDYSQVSFSDENLGNSFVIAFSENYN